MERSDRSYRRRTIQLDIEMCYQSEPPLVVKTRDVSDSGMFIIVANSNNYQVNSPIEIRYKNPLHRSTIAEKSAVIVRKEDDGIGVQFSGF